MPTTLPNNMCKLKALFIWIETGSMSKV